MGNTERKQIPLRVSPERKERWEEYQDELGYGSREAMIRRAVEYFYATKTGAASDELAEEVSAQLDDIMDKLDVLRADVGDVRREQLTEDSIDDIAEEVAFQTTVPTQVVRTPEDIETHLNSMGLGDPTEEQQFISAQSYLWGIRTAAHMIEDPEEREKLETHIEDQEFSFEE